MKVEKPIFILGCGRSGSSIYHKILSNHPNVVWLTRLCSKYPDIPSKNRYLFKLIDLPMFGKYLSRKFGPGEYYDFWEWHCKGFRQPFRDLSASDLTNKSKANIRRVMAELITPKRPRLLIKITGWPRIGFLQQIFKNARFIHIIRDGRAVANSLINVDFWWGWRGPKNWRWGELSVIQKAEWEKHERSFIALSAIQWKIIMDSFEAAKLHMNEKQFLEVKYEDLCKDPLGTIRSTTDFCDLAWSERFATSVKSTKLKNTNYKWKNELTNYQKDTLEQILCNHLKRYDSI
jgi:hypothetical protein